MAMFETKFNIGDKVIDLHNSTNHADVVEVVEIRLQHMLGSDEQRSVVPSYYVKGYTSTGQYFIREVHEHQLAICKTPDTIDWSHVHPDFKWMARDMSENYGVLYTDKPELDHHRNFWRSSGDMSNTRSHASYKRGTVDWKDSLVQRPEGI